MWFFKSQTIMDWKSHCSVHFWPHSYGILESVESSLLRYLSLDQADSVWSDGACSFQRGMVCWLSEKNTVAFILNL